MILVLIAVLAVAGLVALYRSEREQRIKLMSYIIVVLVAVNLLHEAVLALRYSGSFAELQRGKRYDFTREAYRPSQQQPPLLREEQLVVDYLAQRLKAGQHIVTTFRNLHPQRFKLAFAKFQKEHEQVVALHLSSKEAELDLYGLQLAIDKHSQQSPYIILEGYSEREDLGLLKALFEAKGVSLLFRSLSEGFVRSGISQYTEIVELPESYFSALLLKNYPANLVELCSKYVPLNYNFYARTQNQLLSELCCGALPSNTVTECVRAFMHNETEQVELSRIRGCLALGTTEGLLLQNGMARVRKEYYWAGRCDIEQFTHHAAVSPTDAL